MRHRLLSAVVFAVSVLPSAIAARQQPPPPVFRGGVEAVLLDVRVVDREGKFVGGLTKDDFRIFEDDDEQSITTFSEINIPLLRTTTEVVPIPRVAPDVASNGTAQEGRLYLIVLDDLEAETELKGQYQALRAVTVKALARDFVEHHLGPTDRAALIATSNRRELTVEFTSDRRRLLDAIDKFAGGFGQVAYTSACPDNLGPCVDVRDNIHSVMVNLEALAKWLGSISGRRKAMVLVGQRLGRTIRSEFGGSVGGSLIKGDVPEVFRLDLAARENQDVQYFLQAAARANVSLYPIDPVGNPTGAKGSIKIIPLDDNAQFDLDRVMTLTTVAEATGGFATTQTNDFTAAFDRVVEDNSSYYLLGYVSTNSARDGKFRKLRYEVKGAGRSVRGRSGYTMERPAPADAKPAPPNPLSPSLSDLIHAPVPIAEGLALSVTAIPFRRDRTLVSVAIAVEARASDLRFLQQDGRFNGSLELAIVAADNDGRVVGGERGTLTMQLSQGTRDAITSDGVRMLSSLDLKPGRYTLKIGVNDAGGGTNRGSVTHDFVVPDFSKGTLSMSGVALASPTASRTGTKGSPAALARWKPPFGEMPTTLRRFTAEETVRAFVEVYDSDKSKDHAVIVSTSIVSDSGKPVFSGEQNMTFPNDEPSPVTYQIASDLPLQGLAPGDYVVKIEARRGNRRTAEAVRQVPIAVIRSGDK